MNKEVHAMQSARHHRGFTLYELLLTFGLAVAILGLGVPIFSSIVANQRLMIETNAMFHAIHLARKGSVVRRRVVSICPSLNGETCTSMAGWSTGWIVFVNVDRDSPAVRDANEPVLQRHTTLETSQVVANRRSFSLRSTDLRATNGTIVFCDRAGHGTPRAIVLSYTGRPRVAYQNSRGQAYQCSS